MSYNLSSLNTAKAHAFSPDFPLILSESEHNLNDVKVVKPCDFERGVYETKLRHEGFGTPISFLCDGLLKHKGKYYILEIKSTNTKAEPVSVK